MILHVSSLGRRLLKEMFNIINIFGEPVRLDLILRLLEEGNLLQPLYQLYLDKGESIPIVYYVSPFSPMYGVGVPLATMYLPFPVHEVVIFYLLGRNNMFEGKPERSLLILPTSFLLHDVSRYVRVLPCEIIPEVSTREVNYDELLSKLRSVNYEPSLKVLEEIVPHVSATIIDELPRTVITELYPFLLEFLQVLELVDEECRRKVLQFLRSFPGCGYKTISVRYRGMEAGFKVPSYLSELNPFTYPLLNLLLLDLNNDILPILNSCIIQRPLGRRGLLLDLLPVTNENTFKMVYPYEVQLRILRQGRMFNPLTGEEIKMLQLKVPYRKEYFIVY